MIHFLASPAISFHDRSFLSWGWLLAGIASWLVVPGALLLKMAMERQRRRIFAETQPAIDAGIKQLQEMIRKEAASPISARVAIMPFNCPDCSMSFSGRPTPYESVCCPRCNKVILLTPLADELDYE
jgi:hypothetical protein